MNNARYIDVLTDIKACQKALEVEHKALDAAFIEANKTKNVGDSFIYMDETYKVLSISVSIYIGHENHRAPYLVYKCAVLGKTTNKPDIKKVFNLQEEHFKEWAEIQEQRANKIPS